MPRVLIVACGNPLRCDDGLGWRAAEEVANLGLAQGVEIITQHQLTPELAAPVSEADLVLFIDAAQGGEPGEVRCEPVVPARESSAFSHEFTPSGVLNLAQELYGKAAPAFVVSLAGECFDHGTALSGSVVEAMPRLLARVAQLAGDAVPG